MRIPKFLLAVFLLVLPVAVWAASGTDDLVETLYVKSGLSEQVAQLPRVIQAAFDQAVAQDPRLQQMPGGTKAGMRSLILQSFEAQKIEKEILLQMKQKLGKKDIVEVLAWLDSPLGKKCTRLELASSTPEAFAARREFARGLQQNPPGAKRLELVRKLDDAINATETNVEIAINTQVAVFAMIVASMPVEKQIPFGAIREAIEKNRPQFESMMAAETLVSFLYSYQELTDEELAGYVQFAASKSGSQCNDVIMAGLRKALLEGSARWGGSIGNLLKQPQAEHL